MGIEPIGGMFDTPRVGFEDRGHHQVCKHFRKTNEFSRGLAAIDGVGVPPLGGRRQKTG